MAFPIQRSRRLRRNPLLRAMVRETRLSPENFVYPLFVCPGEGIKHEISSMPGNYHWSVDRVVEECREVAALGVPSVILFGLPESKDEIASGAYAADGIVQRAIRAIKAEATADIEPVAQGRVWLGSQAKPRGLVDQLGGLDTAVTLLKKKAGIYAGEDVGLLLYPGRRNLLDLWLKRSQDDALETKLRAVFGRVPFRAWMRGGLLRMMPEWIEVR